MSKPEEKRIGQFSQFVGHALTVLKAEFVGYSLTVVKAGAGAGDVQRRPDTGPYVLPGQVVQLTAVARPGSRFVGWLGDITGAHSVANLRMDSAKTVTAEFCQIESIESADVPLQVAVLRAGTLQQIETKQIGRTGTAPTALIEASSDGPLAAKTSPEKLIGHFYDHGDGTVTDNRTGLMWMRYAVGQTWTGDTIAGKASYHTFAASLKLPSTHLGYDDWRLPTLSELKSLIEVRWEAPTIDVCAFPHTQRSFFLTSSRVVEDESLIWRVNFANGKVHAGSLEASVHIRFVRKCNGMRFPLAVVSSGSGNGSVKRDVEAYDYPSGRTVTLKALAAAGSKFKGWSGDATGQAAVCVVKMNSAKTVSAVFEKIEFLALEVKLTGGGTGVVTRSPNASEYVQGTAVTLTACAAFGSKFKGWSDAAAQATVCTVNMDTAKTIYAEFDQMESYVLQVAINGTGQGVVTQNVDTENYSQSSTATLIAPAAQSSIFPGVINCVSGQAVRLTAFRYTQLWQDASPGKS